MIVVAGAGCFGLAIAYVLARNGHDVVAMTRRQNIVDQLNAHRTVPGYENIQAPKTLQMTTDVAVLEQATHVVLGVPTQHLRTFVHAQRTRLPVVPYLLLQKGIEKNTGLLPSEVVGSDLPGDVSVLSGPNFAHEMVMDLPTATTIASKNIELGFDWAKLFQSGVFRPYVHDDVVGAQVGGAFKNVIAIACGIVRGLGLGDNAAAAIITRGMAEMVRLGVAMGANLETFLGLSGLGDLTLTCQGDQSRNFRFGKALAVQNVWDEATDGTVEGYHTAFSVAQLQEKHNVSLPISECVLALIKGTLHPKEVMMELMERSIKEEVI